MRCFAPEDGEGRGHDWVLVDQVGELWQAMAADFRALWACPCGEFKWTSYADWEAQNATVGTVVDNDPIKSIVPDSSPDSHGVHTRAEPPNTATTRRPPEVTGAAHT